MRNTEDFSEKERELIPEYIRYSIAEVLYNSENERLNNTWQEHWRSASNQDKCRFSNMAKDVLDNLPAILAGTWRGEKNAKPS